jgi:hypothetical protein
LRLPKIEKIEVTSISKKVMNPVDRRQEIILERIIDFYYNTVFTKLQGHKHRLRDLFVTLQQISLMLCHTSTPEEAYQAVIDAVMSNFGFCDIQVIEVNIRAAIMGKRVENLQNPRDLIYRNLTSGNYGSSR